MVWGWNQAGGYRVDIKMVSIVNRSRGPKLRSGVTGMSWLRLLITSTTLVVWAVGARAATFAPEEAAKHVGETVTICGLVASAKYAGQARGRPTFLDFGKPYPNAIFTALILGSDRAKFGTPETGVQGKQGRATGELPLA